MNQPTTQPQVINLPGKTFKPAATPPLLTRNQREELNDKPRSRVRFLLKVAGVLGSPGVVVGLPLANGSYVLVHITAWEFNSDNSLSFTGETFSERYRIQGWIPNSTAQSAWIERQ